MTDNVFALWVYLSASPLYGLTLTLVVYLFAQWLYEHFGSQPLLNPVLVSVLILVGVLWLTDMDYPSYFEGAQFIHFLLGPATVALALPLYRQLQKLRQVVIPFFLALIIGMLVSVITAAGIATLFGLNTETIVSLTPKSVTAPVAMGIAESLGGLPTLTAILVVTTGVIGAIFGTTLFRWMGIKDEAVKGAAMGAVSHGLGTARAFQINEQMGAFAGLAMAVMAMLGAVLLPWLMPMVSTLIKAVL